jgi:hypothetical protein
MMSAAIWRKESGEVVLLFTGVGIKFSVGQIRQGRYHTNIATATDNHDQPN